MAEPLRFKLVDAFTQSSYSGNVAAVVFDADALTSKQMQLIAAEFNASETTFVLNPTTRDAALRFRWFTPGCEVNFCGHATLGGMHALLEDGRFANAFNEPGTIIPIEAKCGMINVRVEKSPSPGGLNTIWLDTPHSEPMKKPVNLPPLLKHLGLTTDDLDSRFKPIRTYDEDIQFAVKSLQQLFELKPDLGGVADYCRRADGLRGVFVTCLQTLSPAMVAQSRFFAPAAGVDEDPVTGSAHGPLGLHLVNSGIVPMNNGRADFHCAQAKAGGRAGLVRVIVTEGDGGHRKVRVGGSCITTATGTLTRLPADTGESRSFKGC